MKKLIKSRTLQQSREPVLGSPGVGRWVRVQKYHSGLMAAFRTSNTTLGQLESSKLLKSWTVHLTWKSWVRQWHLSKLTSLVARSPLHGGFHSRVPNKI